jgi:hypothetical protein
LLSNAKSWDVKSKHDIKGGIWPRAMCPHTSKKRSKPFVKSSRTKQYHKNSYTIPERPPKERHSEKAKTETNASQFKVTSILGWKSSTKGGGGGVNLRKWVEKVKDSRGLIKRHCRCARN